MRTAPQLHMPLPETATRARIGERVKRSRERQRDAAGSGGAGERWRTASAPGNVRTARATAAASASKDLDSISPTQGSTRSGGDQWLLHLEDVMAEVANLNSSHEMVHQNLNVTPQQPVPPTPLVPGRLGRGLIRRDTRVGGGAGRLDSLRRF